MRRRKDSKAEYVVKILKILAFVVVVGLLLVLLYPGFNEIRQLKEQENAVDMEIEAVQEENRQLYRDLKAMSNDPDYIEKVARDNLGYGRPNEIVYKFDKQ